MATKGNMSPTESIRIHLARRDAEPPVHAPGASVLRGSHEIEMAILSQVLAHEPQLLASGEPHEGKHNAILEPFDFMGFPIELRNQVYKYLCGNRCIHIKFIGDMIDPLNIDLENGTYRTLVIENGVRTPELWSLSKGQFEIIEGQGTLARKAKFSTSILYTSKQIHAEASRVFASHSILAITDSLTFKKWMTDSSADQKAHIRHLRLFMDMAKDGSEDGPQSWNKCMTMEMLASLPSVQYLQLTLNFRQRPKDTEVYKDERRVGRSLRHGAAFGTVSNLSSLPLKHVEISVKSMARRRHYYLSDQDGKNWKAEDRQEFADTLKRALLKKT